MPAELQAIHRSVDEGCQRRLFQDNDGHARLCEPEEGRMQQLPCSNAAKSRPGRRDI